MNYVNKCPTTTQLTEEVKILNGIKAQAHKTIKLQNVFGMKTQI